MWVKGGTLLLYFRLFRLLGFFVCRMSWEVSLCVDIVKLIYNRVALT